MNSYTNFFFPTLCSCCCCYCWKSCVTNGGSHPSRQDCPRRIYIYTVIKNVTNFKKYLNNFFFLFFQEKIYKNASVACRAFDTFFLSLYVVTLRGRHVFDKGDLSPSLYITTNSIFSMKRIDQKNREKTLQVNENSTCQGSLEFLNTFVELCHNFKSIKVSQGYMTSV